MTQSKIESALDALRSAIRERDELHAREIAAPKDDPLAEVKTALVAFCRSWGPWESGNPDHIAGAAPEDVLYNACVRACRSGHLPKGDENE